MSLTTNTWDEFQAQVEALCGTQFTGAELRYLGTNLNLAAKRIYNASAWWERFLIVSEPRSIDRGDIAFTEDSFHVYGAGTADVNGLYERNGTANGKARYSKYQTNGTSIDWDIEWDNSTDWQILVGADNTSLTENTVYYDITDSSTTPPTSGWAANTGTAPAPLLVDVAEIGVVMQVNLYDLNNNGNYCPMEYYVTAKGITIPNTSKNLAYVTYKKPLSDTYGDGTGGTVATIPAEWFNFLSLYTARLIQLSNRQSNASPFAVIASSEVDEALQDALMRQEEQNISNGIAKRIQTYLQYNTQL